MKRNIVTKPNSIRLAVLIMLALNFSFTQTFSQSKSQREFGESSFELTSLEKGFEYKSVENTYKVIKMVESGKSVDYLARYTTTTIKNLSIEGQNRTVEVSLSPLNQLRLVKYKMKQACDELDLYTQYYKTIKYGCCSQSNEVALYDYSNNLIIEGSERIFRGNIPNNTLNDFYFSYKTPTDTLTLGQINIWFNKDEKYQIVLKNKRSTLQDSVEVCPILDPQLVVKLNDTDTFDNEETYTFRSLGKIKSSAELNLLFTLTFACDAAMLPIVVPIIDGKPFGKTNQNQIYNVEYK